MMSKILQTGRCSNVLCLSPDVELIKEANSMKLIEMGSSGEGSQFFTVDSVS